VTGDGPKPEERGNVKTKRLLSAVIAVLVTSAALAGGVSAVPAHAQECPPENDTCEGRELDDFVDIFLRGQVEVTGPSQPAQGAIDEFVAAVGNALGSREQAINDELNGMRVAQATAALRTVIGSRNMLRDPDPGIRRDFVRQAAEAAYLAESLLAVTADPQAADELGQVGMAAYALYVTGTVGTGTSRPQPEADGELTIVMGEFIRLLRLILDRVLGGPTADDAAEAKDALEEAVERVRNRDPGEGGSVIEYVALGDSYASGSGTGRDSAPGPVACHRSHLAYPGLLDGVLHSASERRLHAVNKACHGAVVRDYENRQPVAAIEGPQRVHLSQETTGLVTVSMGGNDLGFETIVKACLTNPLGFCGVGEGNPLVPPQKLAQVQTDLERMYINILSRIRPDGQLVILTYPNPAPAAFDVTNSCQVSDFLISEAELDMLNRVVTQIRDMVERAAAAAGGYPRVRVVDMTNAFANHTLCHPADPWVNALVPLPRTLYDSFHPNARGHRQYAKEIAREIGLILPVGF
jgi:lysophospholipase L1-like esterase